MKIRETTTIGNASQSTAESGDETLQELTAQYENGDIEKHAYFEKKCALIRLFLKSAAKQNRSYRH